MVALIIFGTRGVRSTVKEGKFFCPQCISEQRYKHKKVTQFFTLYFIPVIPLGNKGTYVECQSCRNTYIERVLSMQPVIDISEQQPKASNPAIGGSAPRLEEPAPQVAMAAASASAQNTAEKMLSEKQKAIKKLLIMMILADGKVEDAEIHMFHKVYEEIANHHVVDMYKEIEDVRTENKLPHQYLKEVETMLNDEGKNDIIRASMMIAASDGDIDPSEVRMVENFGKALKMKPAEVRTIIDSIKA